MKKCNGVKSDGSQCPMKGSCQTYNAVSASIVLPDAPFTMNNGVFGCREYKLMNERNISGGNYDGQDLIHG